MRTRPIYHSSDAAIRGHVFCSFLALVLQKELLERCRAAGFMPEWDDVLRDLDRLQQAEVIQGGKTWKVRTDVEATASALLRACGIASHRGSKASRRQRQPRPAHPLHRSAGVDPGVVPRAPNFPVFASQVSHLQNRGVEVGCEADPGRARTPASTEWCYGRRVPPDRHAQSNATGCNRSAGANRC